MLAANSNMTPLFEAQDDFKAIEDSISSKFNIPPNANVAVSDLEENHPSKKLQQVKDAIKAEAKVEMADPGPVLELLDRIEQFKREPSNNRLNQDVIDGIEASPAEIRDLLHSAVDVITAEARAALGGEVTIENPEAQLSEIRELILGTADRLGLDPKVFEQLLLRIAKNKKTAANNRLDEVTLNRINYLPKPMIKLIQTGADIIDTMIDNFWAAKHIVEHPGQNDYANPDIEPTFNLYNAPIAIPLSEYIRIRATEQMTFPQNSGIGNSKTAQENIKAGTPAKLTPEELNNLLNNGVDLAHPEQLPEDIRNYIALLSRKFLPGIFRIGFDDLGLMGYLYNTKDTIQGALDKMGIPVNSGYSQEKMDYFGKKVIPALILRSMLSQYEPTDGYKKSDFVKGEKFLGNDVANALRDYIDPLDVQLNSDLDGLDYDGLIDLADTGDIDSTNLLASSTHDEHGNQFTYIPDDNDEPVADNTQLTVTDKDAEYECPAYKSGDWYVVYIKDKEHSEKGWFSFPEPSSIRKDGIFMLNGTGQDEYGRTHGSVGDAWCIVHSGSFNGYGPGSYGEYKPYAYYLVHKDALSPDVLKHDRNDSKYYMTTMGLFFAGCDHNDAKEYTIFTDGHMMSRANWYIFNHGEFEDKYAPLAPKNLPNASNRANWCFIRTIFALNTIGKWDNTITGEENIKTAAQELSKSWFPPFGGKIEVKQKGIPSVHVKDPGSAAILFNGKSPEHQAVTRSIMDGNTLLNIDGTEYKMHMNLGDRVDFAKLGTPEDANTITTPMISFRLDKSNNKWHAINSIPMDYPKRKRIEDDYNEVPELDDSFKPENPVDGIRWCFPASGKSASHRVGFSADHTIYLSDGTDVFEAGKNRANPEIFNGCKCTYVDTPNGKNIFVMASRLHSTSPIRMVGYVRNGKVNFFHVYLMMQSGIALLQDAISGKYRVGDLMGDPKPMNRDEYTGAIAVDGAGNYVDTIGLTPDAIENMLYNRNSQIGLAIQNGRMGEGDDPTLVGIIQWVSGEDMSDIQEETRITMNDIRKDGAKPPFFGER